MKKLGLVLLSLAVATFSYVPQAGAVGSGGISNEAPSAESLSNLTGVAGTKSDPATVYINPAAIGDIGKFSASAGLNYYNFSAERSASNGTSDKMKTGNIPIPNFATVGSIADGKIGWGLAVNSPYGLSTEWEENSNVRYVATKSSIKMLDITPAVSYRPSEKMAFGFGADYYSTFDASLQKKVAVDVVNFLLGFPTSGSADANSKLSGDGSQWGYHTGILYNPTSNHSFGITYHSEVKTRIKGQLEITGLSGASAVAFGGTNFKTDAYTDLFYPQNVQFGYKYSQGDKWELGTNFAWYDWSANQQLAVHLPNANATQKALAETATPLKWRDVWSFTVGGMYRFNDSWKLNAGAYYLPAVYPEETFSPAVPDMNKIGLSVGPSYTKGAWSIDTVYSPLFYKTTTINNTVGQSSTGLASADISGEYKAMIHIIGFNIKYKY